MFFEFIFLFVNIRDPDNLGWLSYCYEIGWFIKIISIFGKFYILHGKSVYLCLLFNLLENTGFIKILMLESCKRRVEWPNHVIWFGCLL